MFNNNPVKFFRKQFHKRQCLHLGCSLQRNWGSQVEKKKNKTQKISSDSIKYRSGQAMDQRMW